VAQGKFGYRADIAFDGEQTITGGALVLIENGVIVGFRSLSCDEHAELDREEKDPHGQHGHSYQP